MLAPLTLLSGYVCYKYDIYIPPETFDEDIIMGHTTPDSKVHGADMRSIWGRQDPGGPHVGPMNFAIWDYLSVPHRLFSHSNPIDSRVPLD